MTLTQRIIDTPVGPVTLVATDHAVVGVYFAEHKRRPDLGAVPQGDAGGANAANSALDAAAVAFADYFAGKAPGVNLPATAQGTDFQRQVWAALRDIPAGETRTYAQIADAIGRPTAVRAVAQAIGANPLSIAVPCHRVVGSDGSITGYAGGVDRKRWLLDHERR